MRTNNKPLISINQLVFAGVFLFLVIRLFSPSTSAFELSPFETKQFMQILGASEDQKPIIALVADWCPACRSAESVLNQKGIPYIRAEIEKEPGASEVYRQLSKRTGNGIPQFIIGNKAYVGFNEAEIIEAIKKL